MGKGKVAGMGMGDDKEEVALLETTSLSRPAKSRCLHRAPNMKCGTDTCRAGREGDEYVGVREKEKRD
jgi:hypothetical protein